MKKRKTKTSTPKTKTATTKTKTRATTKTKTRATTKPKTTKSSPRAPRGFKPLRDTPSVAETHIHDRLMETARNLPDLGGRVHVHRYSNGVVDGEITFAIPRGVSEDQLYRKLLDGFGQYPGHIGPGYWLSIGQRYSIKEGEEVYRRYKGMNEIATYYAAMTRRGITAATFGAARDLMAPGAHDKYKRKAVQVFVRLHWNPNRDKPER